MFESIAAFWAEYGNVLTDGVWDTLVMVVISTAFAYLIGLPLGVALILTQPHGIRPHRCIDADRLHAEHFKCPVT